MTEKTPDPVRVAAGRRGPRITDHDGRLLWMQALWVSPFTHPDGNTTDAVTTAIWVLDGERAPQLQQVTVTQTALVPKLRCHLPGHPPLLARLLAQPHHRHPSRRIWVFLAPSPEDIAHAHDMLRRHGNPFREPPKHPGDTN
jgi:hypothetical protein